MSDFLLAKTQNCRIASPDEERASDHLPIRTHLCLQLDPENNCNDQSIPTMTPRKMYPRVKWDIAGQVQAYKNSVHTTLDAITSDFAKLEQIKDSAEAESAINHCYSLMCSSIHQACEAISCKSGTPNKKTPRHVPWWTRECTITQDRMRFWRSLWIQSGRNRNTHVFHVYKYTKKLYRNARRDAITNLCTSRFNMLSKLFKSGNSKKFWNFISSNKEKCSNSGNISLNTLANFFKDKFSADKKESQEVVAMRTEVDTKYCAMKDKIQEVAPFTYAGVQRFIKKLNVEDLQGMTVFQLNT
jgi:hypothetical protein